MKRFIQFLGSPLLASATIGLGLLIVVVGTTLLNLFNEVCMGIDPTIMWLVGLAITLGVYCGFFLPRFLRIIPADKALIVSNTLKRESSEMLKEFSGDRVIFAQRELPAGPNLVWPWEKPVTEINLMKKIMVDNSENEAEQLYTMKGGARLVQLKWQVPFVPLPGNLVNYSKTGEEGVRKMVRRRAESFLQGFIGDKDPASITFGKDLQKELEQEFRKLYHPPAGSEIDPENYIDPEQRENGFKCGIPKVYDIDEPVDVQKARELYQIWKEYGKIATDLSAESDLTKDQALNLIVLTGGKVKMEVLKVAGIPGIK